MTIDIEHGSARAIFHSSEDMSEVEVPVKLLLCGCTHLGGWATWPGYVDLIRRVIHEEGRAKLAPDGSLVVFQTDAYIDARLMPRGPMLLNEFVTWGWQLLDYKIWKRLQGNFRQPPWSHVYVMAPPGHDSARRPRPDRNAGYFKGVWDYPQTARGKLNSWPDALCEMLVNTFTDPTDMVLDPFAGSCRILAVASALGRQAVGYEIDEDLVPLVEQNLRTTLRRDLTGNLLI